MKRFVCTLLLTTMIFGCAVRDIRTTHSDIVEMPQLSENSDNGSNKETVVDIIFAEIPTILKNPRRITDEAIFDRSTLDCVYLTDGTQMMVPTLVREGDVFLDWYVMRVVADTYQYEDGSIAYGYIRVEFRGETEIRAQVYNVIDSDSGHDGVFVHVDQEDYHLIPSEVNRTRSDITFMLSFSPETDEFIAEEFGGESGVIEDCRIKVKDYVLELTHTDIVDSAKIVSLTRSLSDEIDEALPIPPQVAENPETTIPDEGASADHPHNQPDYYYIGYYNGVDPLRTYFIVIVDAGGNAHEKGSQKWRQ